MLRVMIIGQPGSGKSTLARQLGEITGLPVVHIDKIHYKPGWIERTQDEKMKLCQDVHARNAWIFEGGHSRSWRERALRCDTLVWLDLPLWFRMWRVNWRSIRYYGRTRPDMQENCPERFSWEFIRWIWDTRHSGREKMQWLVDHMPEEKRVVVLRSKKEIAAFLQRIKALS